MSLVRGTKDDENLGHQPPPAVAATFVGMDHVGLLVRDIDASLPFYRDVLGARLLEEQTLDGVGVRVAYLDAGNTLIQLVEPIRPGALMDELAASGEGLHHVCLAVEDIPAALVRLAPGADVEVVLGGRGRRACFLPERPNGLRLELTESVAWAERQTASQVHVDGGISVR